MSYRIPVLDDRMVIVSPGRPCYPAPAHTLTGALPNYLDYLNKDILYSYVRKCMQEVAVYGMLVTVPALRSQHAANMQPPPLPAIINCAPKGIQIMPLLILSVCSVPCTSIL